MRLVCSALLALLVAPLVAAHGTLDMVDSSDLALPAKPDAALGLSASPRSTAAPSPVVLPAFDALPVLPVPGLPALLDDPTAQVEAAPIPVRVIGRSAAGPGGSEDLTFVCPQPFGVIVDVPSGTDDPVTYGCPIRFRDTSYSLINTDIALNVDDPTEVVVTSLHGTTAPDGPHDRSRQSQTHSAFTSDDQGLHWLDQPVGIEQQPSGRALGSDTSVVMDSSGNLYLAYLWDTPLGGNEWDSQVGLYKGSSVRDGSLSSTYDDPRLFAGRDTANRIERVHLAHLPAHVPMRPDTTNMTHNETAPPAGSDRLGEAALVEDTANATDERVVASWHESAADFASSVTALSGWIDVAWTDVGPHNTWRRLKVDDLIGPCSDSSNPITHEGHVYVACVVDNGYADRDRARIGDIDLWEVDLKTGKTHLVAFTGVSGGGHPILSIAEAEFGTRIGLLTYSKRVNDQGVFEQLDIRVAYAWTTGLLENKSPMERLAINLGTPFRQMGGGSNVPVLDADVTAFQLTGEAGTGLLVYKEWHDDPQEPQFDPASPNPEAPILNQLRDYHKYLVSFDSCQGILGGYEVQLGDSVDAFNAEQYAQEPSTFNGNRDGLFLMHETLNGVSSPLVYFSIDDYGSIQYGAVDVLAAAGTCGIGFPPAPLPPAAIPQALSLANPLAGAVGAAFAVPGVAMLGYLLTVKRRAPVTVAAEAK